MLSSIVIFWSASISLVFSAGYYFHTKDTPYDTYTTNIPVTPPTTTIGPDCDYVMVNSDSVHWPIGICINSDGLSYRFDYDETNDEMLAKYFENDDCMGEYHEFYDPQTPTFTNLNTGNLCKSYGFNAQRITRNLTDYEVVVDAPGDYIVRMQVGLFGFCYPFSPNIYFKNIKCKQGVMEWIWYKDSECTDKITPEKYIMSGYFEGLKDIKYYQTFAFGDRYIDFKPPDSEIKYIALDVVCVDEESYIDEPEKHKKK
eukprot:531119_1